MSGGFGLPYWRQCGRGTEESAEAIVAAVVGEGPNLLIQGVGLGDLMDVERQQGMFYQIDLFKESEENVRHCTSGEGGTGPAVLEESQAFTVLSQERALTNALMEEICKRDNLNRAYKRVKSNRGAPGVDGMSVYDLGDWLARHKEGFIASLLDGTYHPQPVLRVEIPKACGGKRQLGIPTVVDRLVQQAIHQVLEPLLDPIFSESSYGFRPGRNAHQALHRSQEYVADGRDIVVDIDIEKFFDRVNHDILMSRLARYISDKRLLRIIRSFLGVGVMVNGVGVERHEGTPQGGPLSPLLSNLLLDDLDKELERRGHCFCRYADDCNIYVRSKASGERVMASVTRFLERKLRLRVNREKSAVAYITERKFLGYCFLAEGHLGIAAQSIARAKKRIRRITRRNRGVSLGQMIRELNAFLIGWVTYFRYAECYSRLDSLDKWIRRKLRCVRLKQRKRAKPIADFLRKNGVPKWSAWLLARSGKGWWRLSLSPQASHAMTLKWFQDQGLVFHTMRYASLQN